MVSVPQVSAIGNMTGLAALEWLRGFHDASAPDEAQPYNPQYASDGAAYKAGYEAGLWVTGRWTGN